MEVNIFEDGSGLLLGTDGYRLRWSCGKGNGVIEYELEIPVALKDRPDEEYAESGNYFYLKVHESPDIYSYVSQSEGGAIRFRDKGRWSGNARGLGFDLGISLTDVNPITKDGAYWPGLHAMPVEDIEPLVRQHFDVPFVVSERGDVIVDWSKIEKKPECMPDKRIRAGMICANRH